LAARLIECPPLKGFAWVRFEVGSKLVTCFAVFLPDFLLVQNEKKESVQARFLSRKQLASGKLTREIVYKNHFRAS